MLQIVVRGKKAGSDLLLFFCYTLTFSHRPTTVKSTFSVQRCQCLL